MSESWWSGLLPVEVQVDCSGETHRIRWEEGALVALDHEDPEGERALGALGADRAVCIGVLDSWNRHADDLRVLTVSSRGVADPVHIEGDAQVPGTGVPMVRPTLGFPVRGVGVRSSGWTGFAPLGARPMMPGQPPGPNDEITNLLMLGGAVAQRLVATVVAAWSERIANDAEAVESHVPALTAALYGRVTSSIRSWLSDSGLEVALVMIPPSESPSMSARDGRIQVRLPFRWLSQIWAKDLPVVLSRFALSTLVSQPDQLQVQTINPDFSEVRPVTIRLD